MARDFFVSYTGRDRAIAEWIAWVIEEAGWSVVFQAWDLRGNFIAGMDAAMRDCERVVLVMSSASLQSAYVAAEWGSALRADPRGTEDRLVVFRVDDCQPEGWLAQIAYTDLLAEPDEAAMRRAIVERLQPGRRKPAQPVAFPGLPAASTGPVRPVRPAQTPGAGPAARALPPPFPAAEHDARRAERLCALLQAWRRTWALQMGEIDAAAPRARQASRPGGGPPPDAEARLLFALADRLAEAIAALPADALADAAQHGMALSPAVVDHHALGQVRSRQALGRFGGPPSAYDWENAARVLEAAQALQRFDLDRLPRGYLEAEALAPPADLRAAGPLLLLRQAGEPGLRLARADALADAPLGRLVARRDELEVHAAQLDGDGRLEVLASDGSSLLAFRAGSPLPTAERRLVGGSGVRAAAFDGAGDARVLHHDGSLTDFGGRRLLPPGPGQALWAPRADATAWHAIGLEPDGRVHRRGSDGSTAVADEPFGPPRWPRYVAKLGPGWNDLRQVAVARLGGLPVALVSRGSMWGEAFAFLDPLTLEPLREPLFVPNTVLRVLSATLAGGRWLLLTAVSEGEPGPRLVVHDLERGGSAPEPVLQALHARGDLHRPLVLQAGRDGFALLAVLRDFAASDDARHMRLLRCRWPPLAEAEPLASRRLAAWAVGGAALTSP